MARNVEKILEEDEDKAVLGVDEEVDTESTAKTGPTPEEAVEQLKKERDEANARADREAEGRREAEARATTAATTAGSAVQSQIAAQEAAIEEKITSAKTKLEATKQQLKQAKAAGDSDAEVELQDTLTDARYALNAAEWEKNQFSTWKAAQEKKPAATTADTKQTYTAPEQKWIDSHPEYKTNKRFQRIANAAAAQALYDEGYKQDSTAFFKFIEDALKDVGLIKDAEEPLSGAGENTTVSTAAAPNRSGGSPAGGINKNSKYPYIPKGFTIPADWVQSATEQGFEDPREYANMRLEDEAKQKGAV